MAPGVHRLGRFYAFGAIIYLIFARDKPQTFATFPTKEEKVEGIKQENKELLIDSKQLAEYKSLWAELLEQLYFTQ